jgi:hypothetical protein
MPTVTELVTQIHELSAPDRHELLRLLMVDSDESDLDAEEAWHNEIVRRVKAIRNGEAAIRALQDDWRE